LADITIFLPGSTDMKRKRNKAEILVRNIEKHNNTVFIGHTHGNVSKNLYDFQLDAWLSSYPGNNTVNPTKKLEQANIRPFGRWFENKFGNIVVKHVSYGGILGISKKHILQHPKSWYVDLIKELSNSDNVEVGHYIERSWEAVFHPMDGAMYMDELV